MHVNTASMTTRLLRTGALVASLLAVTVGTGWAQMTSQPVQGYRQEPGMPAQSLPKPLREIGFDQNLGQSLPLDAKFVDETGQPVTLGDYFGKKPVVLAFVYYECPMLCTQVLNSLISTMTVLSLEPGKDFEIVTISIDSREKPSLAATKKANYLQRFKRPGAETGWHFLTGQESEIQRATRAAGFRYVWDDNLKQFAHPTGVMVVTPQGQMARYLFGVEYGPRDLRLALVEASEGKVGSPVDQVLLYCYHYDPETGKYGFVIMRVVRLAGAATVLLLGAFIVVMIRSDKRRGPADAPRQPKV